MLKSIINFLKRLFGLDKSDKNVIYLEGKITEGDNKLKEIEDEKSNINDIIDRLNK